MKGIVKRAGADFPASIVVFLVALPLCLGVAVASDAAPVAGIIAGIIGGIVIGFLSGSPLSVSGPAAGLTAIVAGAIGKLPAYEVSLWWHNATHADPLQRWVRAQLVELAAGPR